MENIYIVTMWDNYGYNYFYEPEQRAFLTEEEVKEFLLKVNEEENYIDKEKQIVNINNNLHLDMSRNYIHKEYKTKIISTKEFN